MSLSAVIMCSYCVFKYRICNVVIKIDQIHYGGFFDKYVGAKS